MHVFKTTEHQTFQSKECKEIRELKLDFSCSGSEVKYIGLNPNMYLSYYIGVDWLVENEYAIQVNPKITGLDAMKMFMECLKAPFLSAELKRIYHIDLNKTPIETESHNFDITPMLIIHFVAIIKEIVSQGLKKDFIRREENLQSKIKGKIKFSRHLKQNILKGRLERNYCNYQDYSVDCIENQLIKKTLRFAYSYIGLYFKDKKLINDVNYCLSAFENVSDQVDAVMVKRVTINPIFKKYAEALRLSKMILKRFGYSLSETKSQFTEKTPPYWIDMSLLFELYVYGKLYEEHGKKIQYQSKGKYGNVDFLKLDDKIVIDTKYKMIYNTPEYDIKNIRQVSGYARDINIRKKLKAAKDELLSCCIIYPDKTASPNFKDRNLLEKPIEQFEKVYKIGVVLPRIPVE